MRVETHRHVADNQFARAFDKNSLVVVFEQIVGNKRFEFRQIGGEIIFKIDAEFAFNRSLVNLQMTHQLHNCFFTNVVVERHPITDVCRGFVPFDSLVIIFQILQILRVNVLKLADCRNTESVNVRSGAGRIALKIAIQGVVLLSDCQLVGRFGEMV